MPFTPAPLFPPVMFILCRLERRSSGDIACEIERDGVRVEYTIRVRQFEDEPRAMSFVDLPLRDEKELENCDEFRALSKIIWRFVDGAIPSLPMTIVSDWSPERK